jgi:hypothetical protein
MAAVDKLMVVMSVDFAGAEATGTICAARRPAA